MSEDSLGLKNLDFYPRRTDEDVRQDNIVRALVWDWLQIIRVCDPLDLHAKTEIEANTKGENNG